MCLISVACSRAGYDSGQYDSTVREIDLQTKGSGDGKTYIFYLVADESSSGTAPRAFGTYVDAEPGKPLRPADPSSGLYDSSKGLRTQDGFYKLFVASPAQVAPEIYEDSGIYGYEYDRNVDGVYVSEPVPVSVHGVYLSGSNGLEYVYNVSQVLSQPRSKILLNFACGEDIEAATLISLGLSNVIDHGYYIPENMIFKYSSDDILDSYPLFPKSGTGTLTLGTGQVASLEIDDEYVLSMNYKDVDQNGNYKHPMPSLEIEVGSAYGTVSLQAALGFDFRPQHTYEFTITINSVYVTLTVKVSSWVPNGETVGSTIGDTGTWVIQFPLKNGASLLLDWEKVNLSGTIR
jgi:hypothetical protein